MKFPIIDIIDIVVEELSNNEKIIYSLNNIVGELNRRKFFKNILTDITVEEYAQIVFGIFFKLQKEYSDNDLKKIFDNISIFWWLETSQLENENNECENCFGGGYSECTWCDGGGTEDCSNCSGKGEINCQSCDGNGNDDEGDSCGECSGDGSVKCDNCNGMGQEQCSNCDGERFVECNECDGSGIVSGDQYFEYTAYLVAGLTTKSEFRTLEKFEAYNDPKIRDIVGYLKYSVNLYEYSGTVTEGDYIFQNDEIESQSVYFLGLLKDEKKQKFSNVNFGEIENYI